MKTDERRAKRGRKDGKRSGVEIVVVVVVYVCVCVCVCVGGGGGGGSIERGNDGGCGNTNGFERSEGGGGRRGMGGGGDIKRGNISLAGAATSIIFVATNSC